MKKSSQDKNIKMTFKTDQLKISVFNSTFFIDKSENQMISDNNCKDCNFLTYRRSPEIPNINKMKYRSFISYFTMNLQKVVLERNILF